jgi:hypothetical protein
MTLDQLIAQIKLERAQAAGYVQKLDSALSALTKATAAPTAAPADRYFRTEFSLRFCS